MPNIYLKHPTHGAKVAISTDEAEMDKLNGWVEFDPSVVESEPANLSATVNNLPSRRGRPRKAVEPQEE